MDLSGDCGGRGGAPLGPPRAAAAGGGEEVDGGVADGEPEAAVAELPGEARGPLVAAPSTGRPSTSFSTPADPCAALDRTWYSLASSAVGCASDGEK
eukprot:CAMPEP_0175699938 /NCGR_PEP_ID=MMETSP0097-20121207/34730_1 /TAXON_ID=311494 /ORGANISM="Alexandrium monilatum, Strain CCMP3105" /LENGTH=96 /DNA_ID=CAMNT_0017007153 /DNA_START=40 /DNA_END=331 /DNA_ORIENTATION=+